MARWIAACTYLTVGHAVLHVGGAAVAALEVGVVRRGAVEGCVGHVCWVVACSGC
jgi:ABC-type transport system involved in cytochrome c biogenesis permease component